MAADQQTDYQRLARSLEAWQIQAILTAIATDQLSDLQLVLEAQLSLQDQSGLDILTELRYLQEMLLFERHRREAAERSAQSWQRKFIHAANVLRRHM